MDNTKYSVPIGLFILSTTIVHLLGLEYSRFYDYFDSNYSKALHLFYSVIIGALVTIAIKTVSRTRRIYNNLIYHKNKYDIGIRHEKDSQMFTDKMREQLNCKHFNKYLARCFDSLYTAIITGKDYAYSEGLELKCSLVAALDQINQHHGAKLGREIYLFFLEKTAELKPKHVIGIWDIKTNPIPKLEDIKDSDEVFIAYDNMYTSLMINKSEAIERIFIYDASIYNTTAALHNECKDIIKYMINNWGIDKIYFIPEMRAKSHGLYDGLIIDKQFYLSYKLDTHEVSFRNWKSGNSDGDSLDMLLSRCKKISSNKSDPELNKLYFFSN